MSEQASTAVVETKTQRRIVGRVVSNKMDKTITVSVERTVKHQKKTTRFYGKLLRKTSSCMRTTRRNEGQRRRPGRRRRDPSAVAQQSISACVESDRKASAGRRQGA